MIQPKELSRRSLSEWRRKLDLSLHERKFAVQIIRSEKQELKRANERLLELSEAQKILQGVAQSLQQQTQKRISSIVSKCLAIVYNDPYKFIIRFERKRGKTEATLRFLRNGKEINPMKQAGGGVADVAAFALRLACLSFKIPKQRPLVVLDEPFKHVDAAAQQRIKAMLTMLATEMGFQFILSTHSQQLKTGKVIKLKRNK